MEKLYLYGLKRYFLHTNIDENNDMHTLGRVLSVKGIHYEIITGGGARPAELLGKLLYAHEKWEQPKVGDWVTYLDYDNIALISDVLPRVNELYRKAAGRETYKQVIATNIDYAVVIQGLNHDFNISRIERYLVQIATCGIKPVLVLNKSDLILNKDEVKKEVDRLHREVPVYFCSVKTGEGVAALTAHIFKPETTSVLIGSSGVGKSSLVNALTKNKRETHEISQATGKGRHTTTTRDMFLLDNGAIVIDTPGMREFGVGYNDEADFEHVYPAISRYAEGCKFSDCRHISEAGCRVINAYESGELDAVIYESYIKLQKEQKHFQLTTHDKKKQGKQFGKMAREAQAYRKRFKY